MLYYYLRRIPKNFFGQYVDFQLKQINNNYELLFIALA